MVHVNELTIGGEAQLPFGGTKATGVGEQESKWLRTWQFFNNRRAQLARLWEDGLAKKARLSYQCPTQMLMFAYLS
jgi:hypothetical protein